MIPNLKIKQIKWQQTIPLRQSVLWPNKEASFCHVKDDEDATHYGVFIDNEIVCVASLYQKNNCIRLRKFATSLSYQRQGIGSVLLQHMIEQVRAANHECFWCDARETAISFYQHFGLKVEGEIFYKENVPYYKMSILLNKT